MRPSASTTSGDSRPIVRARSPLLPSAGKSARSSGQTIERPYRARACQRPAPSALGAGGGTTTMSAPSSRSAAIRSSRGGWSHGIETKVTSWPAASRALIEAQCMSIPPASYGLGTPAKTVATRTG